MIKRLRVGLVWVLLCFNLLLTNAQSVSGILTDTQSGSAQPGISLVIENTQHETFTNGIGAFRFVNVAPGNYTLLARVNNQFFIVSTFTSQEGENNLGEVKFTPPAINTADDIAVIDVSDLAGIENENDNFSSALSAGRDVFVNAAAYNLGNGRFRPRGYFNEDSEIYMNGMPMNDQDDGRVLWTAWSGLNDVVRVQTPIINLAANDYMFGGIGGGTIVDMRASSQRKQMKAVYSFTNRTYAHRAMFTYSSGLTEKGWAVSLSASQRLGAGYVQGTYLQGISYFASIDKKLNDKHSLNFVIFGTPQRRGRALATTQEVYDLTGSNYFNAVWGYQNGEIRNSREYRINQPVAMLRHDFRISPKTNMTTTLGMQWGTFASTNLDWYQAPDPRADYYRKLPSFVTNPEQKQLLIDYYKDNPDNLLVDWERMYSANSTRNYTVQNANGIEGNTVTGKLAAYVSIAEHFDNEKLSLNSIITSVLSSKVTLSGGIQALHETVHNYRKLEDLLGADFYINYDKFADQLTITNPDAIQNDLNKPNGLVYEGDIYNYNFDLITKKYSGWSQLYYTGAKFDFFGAASITSQSFNREGFMKNGKFPDNSYGLGEGESFLNYGVKGGITYKINGRNYLVVNGSYRTRAPFASDALLSNRTRYQVVDGLTSEKITSAEASYLLRDPELKGRLTAFYTDFKDQLNNITFYLDSDQTFGNLTSNGIGKRHIGVEGGFEKKLNTRFSLILAGSVGQYIYTTRPQATITYDNSTFQRTTTVYIKNYYVPSMPQTAGTFGVNYNSSRYWFFNVNFNYFANNYSDMNPLRRTADAVADIHPTLQADLFKAIIAQEKLPAGYTVDIFCGKSWRLKGNKFLAANLNVGNILNNQDLKIGGREQLRFDFVNRDVNRFPPRYFYAFGLNYNLNISLRF